MNSCSRAVSFLLFTAAYFFLPPLLLPLLSVHSNLAKDHLFVTHRNCIILTIVFLDVNMSNFLFPYYLNIVRGFGRGMKSRKLTIVDRIRRCRVIIREKRISRLSRDEGRRERKGTRVRVRNTYAEDIPSAEKRGKSRVNPLIMSQIRGTCFAENDSDVREICKSRRVERGALVRFIF